MCLWHPELQKTNHSKAAAADAVHMGHPPALRQFHTRLRGRLGREGRRLLLKWLEEQAGGAAQAMASVRDTLKDAKAAARKRQTADHAARVRTVLSALLTETHNDETVSSSTSLNLPLHTRQSLRAFLVAAAWVPAHDARHASFCACCQNRQGGAPCFP